MNTTTAKKREISDEIDKIFTSDVIKTPTSLPPTQKLSSQGKFKTKYSDFDTATQEEELANLYHCFDDTSYEFTKKAEKYLYTYDSTPNALRPIYSSLKEIERQSREVNK